MTNKMHFRRKSEKCTFAGQVCIATYTPIYEMAIGCEIHTYHMRHRGQHPWEITPLVDACELQMASKTPSSHAGKVRYFVNSFTLCSFVIMIVCFCGNIHPVGFMSSNGIRTQLFPLAKWRCVRQLLHFKFLLGIDGMNTNEPHSVLISMVYSHTLSVSCPLKQYENIPYL